MHKPEKKIVKSTNTLQQSHSLTVQCGQDLHVFGVEEGERVLSDVEVGQVREEVIAHQEPHQHPVINDLLKVIAKRYLILEKRMQHTDDHNNLYTRVHVYCRRKHALSQKTTELACTVHLYKYSAQTATKVCDQFEVR